MSMCAIALLKAKTFKAFAIYFSVYLLDRSKITSFCSKVLISVLHDIFAIVVLINKAFKLFKLVLVVYCDSCCHW